MSEMGIQDSLFGDAAPEVRILTVKQPYAWALIHGGKDVENRSRYCSYRGLLLIHAGQSVDRDGVKFLESLGVTLPAEAFRAGHIVGSVEVTGCTGDSPSRWAFPGQWHITVTGPVPATATVTMRGNLGLQAPPEGWQRAFA